MTGNPSYVVKGITMHMTGTNVLRCLLALGLMSGLVACGSFANCFNSGFAPAACGGGYSESDVSSLSQPTATSAEGRWMGATAIGRTVAGLVLDDGSYWLFYTAKDQPTSWQDSFRALARLTPAPSVPRTPEISIWKARAFARRQ